MGIKVLPILEMSVELFYYAISPPARACELVLMLNKVDFKLTEVDLFKGEQNKPEFLAINPAHCIPTLKDGDFADPCRPISKPKRKSFTVNSLFSRSPS